MTCPKCKRESLTLTRDHRIPRWLFTNLHWLGVNPINYRQPVLDLMCVDCNRYKSGFLDYSDKEVRVFMTKMCKEIMFQVDKNSTHTKVLRPTCLCQPSPPTTPPVPALNYKDFQSNKVVDYYSSEHH